MDSVKDYNWIKNFGIRLSLFTVHCLGKGNNESISKQTGLANIPKYIYIDAEEVRAVTDIDNLKKSIAADPIRNGGRAVSVLKKASIEINELSRKIGSEFNSYSEKIFLEKYLEFFQECVDWFGIADIQVLTEDIYGDKIKEATNEDAEALLTYIGESDPTRQKRLITEMALDIKKGVDIEKKMKDFLEEYVWSGMRVFFGEPKTLEDVLKVIKEIDNPEKELQKLKKRREKAKKEFDEAFVRIKDEEIKDYVKMIQDFMHIRDYRYMKLCHGYYMVKPFMEQFGKQLGLTFMELIHLLPEEVEKLYSDKSLLNEYKKMANKRLKKFAYIHMNGEYKILTGEEVDELSEELFGKQEDIDFVEGIVANKGFVKGRVRLILDKPDLVYFKKGEILVTNMTTPDYMSAMEKASAIVTDIGGITSHAAIVSRELGIPCVINTKNASKAFKTGDKIEVDANKGLVRKI
ncbi:hypothetical protein HQ533_03710 [Candidatus Woesearchaeota archaeon]|nr:hypothetical protein [Candidatus Woesearchaeota archaeon]